MKSYLIFILIAIGVASCNKKHNVDKGVNLDDRNVIYDMYAGNHSYFDNHIDNIFNSQEGKKANIITGYPAKEIQYFTVDSIELKSIKKCLYNFLATNDSLYTLKHYYRQYIGYKLSNKKFVYVNLFTHIQCRGESQPAIDKTIYTENEGQCNFGHIVINIDSNEVTECEFINEPF